MIVDHDKKFVFIHIPKTGGTSVSTFLGFDQRPANPHRVEPETPKRYSNYLRFCFVRNPWARLFSSYNYAQKMASQGIINGDFVRQLCQDRPDLSFEDFVNDFLSDKVVRGSAHFRPQMRWISQSAPQFIGRVETMESDTAFLCHALNVPQAPMDHKNRSSTGNYLEVYTPAMINKVMALYRADISSLGYSFER